MTANSLVRSVHHASWSFGTGSIKHSISVGAEFSWEKARRGTYVLATGSTITPSRFTPDALARYFCTSLFSPNSSDPWANYTSDSSTVTTPLTKRLPVTETQNDARTRSVYAFDSITLLPELILNLGVRYDDFKSTLTPGQAATAVGGFRLSRQDKLFNWQAGVIFKPTPSTWLYASYATAATRPTSLLGEGQEGNAIPTTATAANLLLLDSLKVEKTKSYEVAPRRMCSTSNSP